MRLLAGGLVLGLVSMSPSTAAEEIGKAVRVDPDVQGHLPGKPSREIEDNDAIERGLRVQLAGPKPYLKVAFNFGGTCELPPGTRTHRFTGTARLQGASEVSFGDLANLSASRIGLVLGKLWLALHPKVSAPDRDAGCQVDVDTPHARVLVKGTYLRMLVDPVVGTFVAVDEGAVSVQAKAGGAPVEVTAGHWVLVPPDGLPTRPAPLLPGEDDEIFPDPPLLDCCDGTTEPPKPPRE